MPGQRVSKNQGSKCEPQSIGFLLKGQPPKGPPIHRNSRIFLKRINSQPALYQPQTLLKGPSTQFEGPPIYRNGHIGLTRISSELNLPFIYPQTLLKEPKTHFQGPPTGPGPDLRV